MMLAASKLDGDMGGTRCSLPIVRSPSRQQMQTTAGSGGAMNRSMFSTNGSGGPGIYGSQQYIDKLELQLVGSKRSEDRMATRLAKVEDETFQLKRKNARLKEGEQEDDETRDEKAMRMGLDRARRDLRTVEKNGVLLRKKHEKRIRMLEDTVGDVQTELIQALSKLRFLKDDNIQMKEKMEAIQDTGRRLELKDKKRREEELVEKKRHTEAVTAVTAERDVLQKEINKLKAASVGTTTNLEGELRTLREQVKTMSHHKSRADRLEELANEVNEARSAKGAYLDRMNKMEAGAETMKKDLLKWKNTCSDLQKEVDELTEKVAGYEHGLSTQIDPETQRGALAGWTALMKGEMAKAKLNPKVKKALDARLEELQGKLLLNA